MQNHLLPDKMVTASRTAAKSVVSSGSMIKTGELKVSMRWEDGKKTPSPSDDRKDTSQGQIFKYDKWEPT